MTDTKKTSNYSDSGKTGTKEIRVTYGILRKSDIFFYILPGFYLLIILFISFCIVYGDNFVSKLKSLIAFVFSNPWVGIFLFLPLFFLLIYLLGLVINILAAKYFVHNKKVYDQMYAKNSFFCDTNNRYSKTINEELGTFIKSYNKVFGKNLDTADFYDNVALYWNLFHYVMDEYYGKENVYDDLRKALFIRNIYMANLIGAGIMFILAVYMVGISDYQYKVGLGLGLPVLLLILNFVVFDAYKNQIKFYLFKLFITFIYLTTKNVKKEK